MNCVLKKHKTIINAVQCNWTRIHRFLSERKKFFKDARICHSDGGFEINLDTRKLRSPTGIVLKLPTEGLAHAVANEWNMQDGTVKLDRMPLTALSFVTVDNTSKRNKESFAKAALKYLSTDTVLCQATEPPELALDVVEKWTPLINWVTDRYSVSIKPASGFEMPQISPETYDVLSKHLMSYNYWSVVGFESVANVLKSLIIALAIVDRHVTIEEAVGLSRLEQEFQISKWGNVVWYHDVELMDMRMKTAACALFIQLSSEQSYSSQLRTGSYV